MHPLISVVLLEIHIALQISISLLDQNPLSGSLPSIRKGLRGLSLTAIKKKNERCPNVELDTKSYVIHIFSFKRHLLIWPKYVCTARKVMVFGVEVVNRFK